MKTSEYRREARIALTGNLGWAILILLVYSAIMSFASSFSIGIGTIIITGALTAGLCRAFLGLLRSKRLEFNDLFSFFNQNFVNALVMGLLQTVFVFLWSLLFLIPGIVASYSYSMAPYILADYPELNGSDAITVSKKLMQGKKGRLFCLHFSFIGWILLSILTFGILLFVYVEPYMQTAQAAFYESIKHEVPAFLPEGIGMNDNNNNNHTESV